MTQQKLQDVAYMILKVKEAQQTWASLKIPKQYEATRKSILYDVDNYVKTVSTQIQSPLNGESLDNLSTSLEYLFFNINFTVLVENEMGLLHSFSKNNPTDMALKKEIQDSFKDLSKLFSDFMEAESGKTDKTIENKLKLLGESIALDIKMSGIRGGYED